MLLFPAADVPGRHAGPRRALRVADAHPGAAAAPGHVRPGGQVAVDRDRGQDRGPVRPALDARRTMRADLAAAHPLPQCRHPASRRLPGVLRRQDAAAASCLRRAAFLVLQGVDRAVGHDAAAEPRRGGAARLLPAEHRALVDGPAPQARDLRELPRRGRPDAGVRRGRPRPGRRPDQGDRRDPDQEHGAGRRTALDQPGDARRRHAREVAAQPGAAHRRGGDPAPSPPC